MIFTIINLGYRNNAHYHETENKIPVSIDEIPNTNANGKKRIIVKYVFITQSLKT